MAAIPVIDTIAEDPVKTVFFIIGVVGVILITSTVPVAKCPTLEEPEPATAEDLKNLGRGAIVKILDEIEVDDIELDAGACAVVTRVRSSKGTVEVEPIKYPPPSTSSLEQVSLTGVLSSPVETVSFLRSGPPSIKLDADKIAIVGTDGFSNLMRVGLAPFLRFLAVVLLLISGAIYYIGRKNEKERREMYIRQSLRTLHRAKLLRNKPQLTEWENTWKIIAGGEHTDYTSETQRGIKVMLDEVLLTLEFAGETEEERVRNLTDKDVYCAKLLQKVYKELTHSSDISRTLDEKTVQKQKENVARIFTALGVIRRSEGIFD